MYPRNRESYPAPGNITDENNPATGLSRRGDGICARQLGVFAIVTTKVQAQVEHFTATAANLDGMFFVEVWLSINTLGLITGRTDNSGHVVADMRFNVIHSLFMEGGFVV